MTNITGTNGNDNLLGTAHADRLAPLLGFDWVDGGAGQDTLVVDYRATGTGGYSYSNVYSVGGSFVGYFQSGDGQNAISSQNIERLELKLDNGDGTFWLDGSALALGASVDVDAGAGLDMLEANFSSLDGISFEVGPNGKVKLGGSSFSNFESYYLTLGDGADQVKLGAGDDTVWSFGGNDSIDTAAGDDFVAAGVGDDSVNGGSGDDTIYGEGGSNVLLGGVGDDSLISSGSDQVDGGEGYDYWQGDYRFTTTGLSFTYNGSSGSVSNGTTLTSIEHLDFFGGDGDDVVTISGARATPEGTNSVGMWAGAGYDTLSVDLADGAIGTDHIFIHFDGTPFSGVAHGVFFSDFEEVSLSGDEGDWAHLGLSFDGGVEAVVQPDGTLTTNVGVTLFNYASFELELGAGDDIVVAGGGDDVVHGLDGNDTIDGAAGNDFIFGGNGDDRLSGGEGDDLVIAGEGNDTLDGGTGNDALYGEGGTNILIGGDGDDNLISQGTDNVDGGEGNDYWQGDYQSATEGLSFTYDGSSGSVSNGTTLTNIENVSFLSGSGDDLCAITGAGPSPEGGNPVGIYVGAGYDTLNADLGDGAVSRDLISVSREGTSFTGLAGGVFFSEFEEASFTGETGDTASLSLFSFDDGLDVAVQPDGTLTTDIGITLYNYSVFRLQLGDGNDTVVTGVGRDTIRGMGGDDIISGGAGGDSLFGGEGADTFLYNSIADTGFGTGRVDGILDFSVEEGDKIDLQNVIADEFSFIGTDAFSGSGAAELRTQDAGVNGEVLVQGDTNGDGVVDLSFVVIPTGALTASDFLL